MGREPGSKVVDGKVVAPVELNELPDLGVAEQVKTDEPLQDGRIEVIPSHGGRWIVGVQPSPAKSILQARNKLNQWVTKVEISNKGGKITLKPPPKPDASQEYTAVRLLEATCGVNFGGSKDAGTE